MIPFLGRGGGELVSRPVTAEKMQYRQHRGTSTELEFHFHTGVEFSAPVSGHTFALHCLPVEDDAKKLQSYTVRIEPAAEYGLHRDGFGGWLVCGSCREPHTGFCCDSHGIVRVDGRAQEAVAAVLRYLSRVGLLRYNCHSGYLSSVVQESEMANVLTPAGGIFRRFVEPGQEVEYGQKLGVILDPFTAEVEAEILCPTSGVVFFALKKPLTTEHEVAFKVIRRLFVNRS